MQVASTNDERWQWRKVKRKNDRRDALKLAQLSARNELDLVHVPQSEMRQWRALIAYRHHLVQRRTKIKNHIRELLLREGQLLARQRSAWTQDGLAALEAMGKPLGEVAMDELWRGELEVELAQFKAVQKQLTEVVAKLDALGAANRLHILVEVVGQIVNIWRNLYNSGHAEGESDPSNHITASYSRLMLVRVSSGIIIIHKGQLTS
jgi:transposase